MVLPHYFWSDCWVGSVLLRERFRRLYDLSTNKDVTVGEMHALGWVEEGETWGWRHRLLAWEEELVGKLSFYLLTYLYKILLVWMSGFGARMQEMTIQYVVCIKCSWGRRFMIMMPFRKRCCIKMFLWRCLSVHGDFFRNRWPTKDKLWRSGVVTPQIFDPRHYVYFFLLEKHDYFFFIDKHNKFITIT